MSSKITFFPVGNGDMTLIKLSSGKTLLIDVNIRNNADKESEDERDAASDLRDRLKKDDEGRYFVDAFLLTHPDQDHCGGIRNHFHLGSPDSLEGDAILIREIWSSPIVFRRKKRDESLCEDAKAFQEEAKRRVKRYREAGLDVPDGDRILILGKDQDGKTDDLAEILIEVDGLISEINRASDQSFEARLLGPLPFADDEEDDEELLAKNNSSVILQIKVSEGDEVCKFLTGGDAEVEIWERMWNRHEENSDWLEYHLLQAPHHCSWHSLSRDSWSDTGDDAEVSESARNALGQALSGAYIVASSNPIKDDDNDPPCIRAKREYESILSEVSGTFECVGSHPSDSAPEPLEFEIGASGLQLCSIALGGAATLSKGTSHGEPLGHG